MASSVYLYLSVAKEHDATPGDLLRKMDYCVVVKKKSFARHEHPSSLVRHSKIAYNARYTNKSLTKQAE